DNADDYEDLSLGTASVDTVLSDTDTVTYVTISGDASVGEGDTASYTLTLDYLPASDVTVNLVYSGVAADGSDFTGVATVIIPANQSSVNFNIDTIDDVAIEGAESFTITIDSATGGGFESLLISPTEDSITTTIVDDESPISYVIDLSVDNSTITEAGGTLTYTLTLTDGTDPVNADSDIEITLTTPDGQTHTVTISSGSSTGTYQYVVDADEDALAEADEILEASAVISDPGTYEDLSLGTASVDTVLSDT
ncbi:MAG: immunoglobulin-like domain-containing protein, partial [Methylotenera sp.]